MPDTNNREYGSKEEHERFRRVHKVDDESERARLERELESVEEDRSGQRLRGGGGEQFTAPGGEGQQYRPRFDKDTDTKE
jgi:hypothetical protein